MEPDLPSRQASRSRSDSLRSKFRGHQTTLQFPGHQTQFRRYRSVPLGRLDQTQYDLARSPKIRAGGEHSCCPLRDLAAAMGFTKVRRGCPVLRAVLARNRRAERGGWDRRQVEVFWQHGRGECQNGAAY